MPPLAKDATSRAVPERSEPSPVLVTGALRSGERASEQAERPEVPVALPLGRLALAAAQLALAAGSLYLCVRFFLLPDAQRHTYLVRNLIDARVRATLLLQAFAAAALPLAVGGAVLVRWRNSAVGMLQRAGDMCAPLILSCFVPSLLDYNEWYDKPLPYLIQLLAFVLVLERLLSRAWGANSSARAAYAPATSPATTRYGRVAPLVVVVLFSVGYAAYMSYYTIMRHRLMGTAGFDLGIFDNLMFNALHGRPFKSTVAVPNGSYLSNHAEYGLYLFLPLYALRPGADTLLVLQSTMMGLAAIPLYFFCATQISRPAAAALSCAYLFFAPLHGPNFYDFHWMPMAMFFFHWLFYTAAKRQPVALAVLTAVCCSMREDAAFGTTVVGLFLIVTRYWVRAGAWLTVVSAMWFVLVKFVIMPWAGPWWFADIYKDLMFDGERGYGSVLKTAITNPNYFLKTLLTESKFVYSLHMLAPLALLPLRHAAFGLLVIPGFIVTLMTTGYPPTLAISFQYTTTWIPFLFAAAAMALRLRAQEFGAAARSASVAAVCAGVLIHSYVFGAILQHNTFVGGFSRVFFTMSEGERKRYADLQAVVKRIPRDVSVAATELEIPHVATRLNAYTLKITSGDADYIFLHRHHFDSDARSHVRSAMKKEPYGLVAKKGEFYLFAKKQNLGAPETAEALKTLSLPAPPKP